MRAWCNSGHRRQLAEALLFIEQAQRDPHSTRRTPARRAPSALMVRIIGSTYSSQVAQDLHGAAPRESARSLVAGPSAADQCLLRICRTSSTHRTRMSNVAAGAPGSTVTGSRGILDGTGDTEWRGPASISGTDQAMLVAIELRTIEICAVETVKTRGLPGQDIGQDPLVEQRRSPERFPWVFSGCAVPPGSRAQHRSAAETSRPRCSASAAKYASKSPIIGRAVVTPVLPALGGAGAADGMRCRPSTRLSAAGEFWARYRSGWHLAITRKLSAVRRAWDFLLPTPGPGDELHGTLSAEIGLSIQMMPERNSRLERHYAGPMGRTAEDSEICCLGL